MRLLVLTLVLGLATPIFAADIPTYTPPTVSERMDSARQAIDRKGWSRAQYDLKSVVSEEPGNADAHNLLAYTYRKQDRPDLPNAFVHYKIALKINPDHRGAHEYIGEAYLMDRKPAEAAWHLAELERICGNRNCEEYQDLASAISSYR